MRPSSTSRTGAREASRDRERTNDGASRGLPPWRWLVALVLVAVAAAVLAVAIGRHVAGGAFGPASAHRFAPAPPPAQRLGTPSPQRVVAAPSRGFVTFEDSRKGFSIAYPASWQRLRSKSAGVELLARRGGASLLVRTVPTGFIFGPSNLVAARALTDTIVAAGTGVRLLASPARIRLGGLDGFAYTYSFAAAPGAERGAHVHYLLFDGTRLIAVVLQALPADELARAGPVFAQILGTFRRSR